MVKRNMQKSLAIGFSAVMALSLAACGNSGNNANDSAATNAPNSTNSTNSGGNAAEPATDSGKKVTITFQNIYPDPATPSHKMINELTEQYMKDHPNVTIELDTLNTDQQKVKLKTQAASKEVPDITIVNPAAQMKPFVDAGLFAPLNDVLDQNGLKDTYQEGLLDYYSFDGNVYALPDGNNIEVVYYNKELFEQAGIANTPTTFEEMLQDVKILKDKGITPLAIGEKDSWTGSFLFMNILLRTNGGPGFLQDVMNGKKTFEDPAFIEAVDAFQQLVQAGAFPDGATSIDANAGGNIFKSGKAAMWVIGSWETGAIDASSVAGKVGAFQFPTVNGKGNPNEFMLAPGSAFAISANSEHLAETKDFLNFFASNLPKKQFELKNAVGLGQKVDGDLKAAGYSDLAVNIAGLFNQVQGGDLAFDNTMNPATAQVHLSSIQNLFVQKVDSAAVAKEHQQAFEANKE
ncbi:MULTISPECIES: extracellular solute-binding protein [unclassified Paenibacillus]|uniref:extracellular solute-binding protein n=1 Tax=unclassified Paenibacillus TaxID=185978 RepID=UPI0024070D6B|nr:MULTISPECIES: extracellular solute-binding protein [unclassified Paenibacillus]MDF9841211.1 raffinose/stachyose/melibiose transport system substrate-binding protein [Paenibacillus sp. PastF-2]MDF9847617.1 raffinose/stachyose/melibiose transport system substrate-binding protein [Paenibacillus sp. PastM-2]MDF9854186.1 raffinose/stachyose/melibiose transport system substrate-binding protein [Paenibacillus sp. PastF-1]MDH6479643.1 raffinose/stachyose/melibiose transport system substrate-binding 